MNNPFLSLNDEDEDLDENLYLCSDDSWPGPKSKVSSRSFSLFQELNPAKSDKSSTAREDKWQLSYRDDFDSDEEELQRGLFCEYTRPRTSGSIPKSRKNLSTNISDPCLLSKTSNEILNSIPAKHLENNIEIDSLDSGIPEDSCSGIAKVQNNL